MLSYTQYHQSTKDDIEILGCVIEKDKY